MGIHLHEVFYDRRMASFVCCKCFIKTFLELARHTRRSTNNVCRYTTVVCPFCNSQATFPLFDMSNKPGWTIRDIVEYDNLTLEEKVALRLMS